MVGRDVEYLRGLAQVAAAQICEGLGFDAIQKSACDALAEVMLRYISEIGIAVHQCAERAGRTEGNVHDILAAFDQLGTSMRSVMEYGTKSEEVPFARPLPRFPLQKVPRLPPSFKDAKEEPPAHIPAFLPALPDQHTYKETPVYEGRQIEAGQAKLEMHQSFRKAEKALISLQERTHPSAPANYLQVTNSVCWENQISKPREPYKPKDGEMPNPFLQPPVDAVSGAPLPDSVPASSKTIAASSEGTQLVPTPLATKALQAVVGGGDTRHSDLGLDYDTAGGVGGAPQVWPGLKGGAEREPLKFSLDFSSRTRRVARAVRDCAPNVATKRPFQTAAIGEMDETKEIKLRRAKAIMSGAVGMVVDDDPAT
mmetsp:Transcript_14166/g.23984  ORF Transcript_14166/g.23984 Transcript_14166/m.23984 type:complete len:369 (+) Transcript_14166:472-1578(+)|eukprot:CAMPEP_0198197400 /NCGR_PEP_ID=MMETSP1445-20131203/1039_1 /TAXON_ID=36898 /ORGANISM="Pyramimonas sp., Strain CCMP2087" /LENGTH=368 /DNA_ID=CAMNT_0043866685 /DNA_START=451 /DNA_END=1557 /DNA_ORIENTATION=-